MDPHRTASPTSRPDGSAAPPDVDVAIVGGGINGCGIARDLAGRGVRVLLAEKDDLAAHTSSASTKLIHGGLRYLEHREFALVRKALGEREVLLKGAPHIMWPLRFVMPHDRAMRPAWMIRIGLFLYDHLAPREMLEGSRRVDLKTHPAGAPLAARFRTGFVYSDGWVDDARLVVLCAIDAAERGAEILTRWRCVDARREPGRWRLTLESDRGARRSVTARALVNAAGPWAAQFLAEHAHVPRAATLRLVKGSHIVVRKRFEHDHAYIFQNPDGRIIFAIPYERDFTLIGTTDVEHHGAIGAAQIDAGEIEYLCEQASRYFARPVTPAEVVWTYSGVRPLLDDENGNPAAVTRDYRLELDTRGAPLLSVWGGKITTFRKLAEEAGDRLAPTLGLAKAGGAWTHTAPLPGGDLAAWLERHASGSGGATPRATGATGGGVAPDAAAASAGTSAPVAGAPHATATPATQPGADLFERFVDALVREHPRVPAGVLRRWARAYGTRVERVLAGPLGHEIAPGVYAAELEYLWRDEWARSSDDALWRRSKLGLHLDAAGRSAIAGWFEARRAQPAAEAATVER
ncbi:glycerol-3-phosphate dehydrogenase [Piscinibacter koreensis]|uniref:glycerol-3-phosphate dehydrogenase n=1 Tax=Piscinibacter koreensis TaxID=2742824 RepID=UPI001FEC1125|nr:glycerol-3-phosphate dehydrogenase [Schlegelella koreensis]